MPAPPVRVLLVSSTEPDGCGVRSELASAGFSIEVAPSAQDAELRARARRYDAFVVDWQLSESRRLVERLRAVGVDEPVLALTACGTAEARVAALEAGADDSLALPVAPKELAARLRAKLRRSAQARGCQVVRTGPLVLDVDRHRVTMCGPLGCSVLCLRRKEFAMLHAFMRDAGAMIPRAVLRDRVWGEGLHVSRNTFDVTLSGLRQKLQEAAQASGAVDAPYVETIRGAGYQLSTRDA